MCGGEAKLYWNSNNSVGIERGDRTMMHHHTRVMEEDADLPLGGLGIVIAWGFTGRFCRAGFYSVDIQGGMRLIYGLTA